MFSSFWFTAIYVLLFISLVGCLTPRLLEHFRSMRAVPGARAAQPGPAAQAPHRRGRRRAAAAWPRSSTTGCAAGGTSPAPRATIDRDLRGEGLSARIRQHRLPLLAARSAGRDRRRQAVRLRGQRHRRRRRRPRILLGVAGRVRLVPGGQHRRRHLAESDLRAGQRLQGRLSAQRAGRVVPRRHRLPGRRRPRRPTPGGRTCSRSTSRCGSAATGSTCRATATRRRSPSPSPTGRPAPRRCSGGPTTRSRSCPRVRCASIRPAGTYPDAEERRKNQIAIQGLFAPTGQLDGTLLSSSFPALNDPAVAIDIYKGDTGLDTGRPQSLFSLDPRLIDQGRLTKRSRVNLRAGAGRPACRTAPTSGSTAPCRSSTCRCRTTPRRSGCWCSR